MHGAPRCPPPGAPLRCPKQHAQSTAPCHGPTQVWCQRPRQRQSREEAATQSAQSPRRARPCHRRPSGPRTPLEAGDLTEGPMTILSTSMCVPAGGCGERAATNQRADVPRAESAPAPVESGPMLQSAASDVGRQGRVWSGKLHRMSRADCPRSCVPRAALASGVWAAESRDSRQATQHASVALARALAAAQAGLLTAAAAAAAAAPPPLASGQLAG
jgi:hypothetical protein